MYNSAQITRNTSLRVENCEILSLFTCLFVSSAHYYNQRSLTIAAIIIIIFCINYWLFAAMLTASQAFGDAVKEVYEPDWHGTEQLSSLLEV